MGTNNRTNVFLMSDEKMLKLVNEFNLSYKDKRDIEKAFKDTADKTFNYYDKASYKNFLKELYVLINYSNFTPTDIATAYDMGLRMVQTILKKYGWSLDKYEAQRRATLKRDYRDILIKCRQTRSKVVSGSNIEEYIRHQLYCSLQLINNTDAEIIVGINSTHFIGNLEADIPVIVINNGKIYKFVVEVDGGFWHEESRDLNKDILFKEIGYRVFRLKIKNSPTNKYIDNEILNISKEILDLVA